jgi:hypothetical protein
MASGCEAAVWLKPSRAQLDAAQWMRYELRFQPPIAHYRVRILDGIVDERTALASPANRA